MLEVVEFRKRGLPTFAEILDLSQSGWSLVLPRFFAYFFIMEKVRDENYVSVYKKPLSQIFLI